MKKLVLLFACGFLLAGTTAAWAGHPPVYNPCDPWIRPRPTPPPASPTPPPATDRPEPEDPNQSFDPGQPFMEGSGKFGCSLHAAAGASPVSLGLLGLGLTTPLLWRRKRVQK